MKLRHATVVALLSVLCVWSVGCSSSGDSEGGEFSLERIQKAKTDILGEAALRQPDGPSYDFFAKAMPPLRYVDANFHHYPITLSAPSNPSKARLVSNGSCINALGRQPTWNSEAGRPVSFLVGDNREEFGSN